MTSLKSFLRIAFASFTIISAILYGLSCLSPFISPLHFTMMGFLGLAFPVLLLLVMLLALIWFFIKKKTALLLLALIASGFYHIIHVFGFNSTGQFAINKIPGTVRIMGWNVQGFHTLNIERDSSNSIRHQLLKYIQQQQPDIICLQDFLDFRNQMMPSNVSSLADSMGYRYYITSNDYVEYPPWGPAFSGIAIFSRYPLQNTKRILFTGKKVPESILIADVVINGITRRLVATHLQSMHIGHASPADDSHWSVSNEDSIVNKSKSGFRKLSFYLPYHARQATLVKKIIDESPWPVIFSADMNEVPSSWCYHKIKGELQDAFLLKGNGMGRTYTAVSPTLRIDYLMAAKSIKITQYIKDTVHLSDHYPQMMDVKW